MATPSAWIRYPGHGFSNYENIFTRRTEGGPSAEPAQKKHGMSIPDFVALMDRAGVEVGVLRAGNAINAEVLAQYPKRFIGLATISPHDGMRGVRELVRLVKDHGFGALRVSALYNMVPAERPPLLPAVREVRRAGYSSPYLHQHELRDRSARMISGIHDTSIRSRWIFRNCASIAGLGGWPWINETVALLRRHPNLYADTASHRPRYFGQPGSGWEQFLQFGNTLLQDKIMVGLSWEAFGVPMETLVEEYASLPLKAHVLEKWLYSNAKRFFRLG